MEKGRGFPRSKSGVEAYSSQGASHGFRGRGDEGGGARYGDGYRSYSDGYMYERGGSYYGNETGGRGGRMDSGSRYGNGPRNHYDGGSHRGEQFIRSSGDAWYTEIEGSGVETLYGYSNTLGSDKV